MFASPSGCNAQERPTPRAGVRAEGDKAGRRSSVQHPGLCFARVRRAGEAGTRLLVRERAGLPRRGRVNVRAFPGVALLPSSSISVAQRCNGGSSLLPLSLPPWFFLPPSPCLPSSFLSKIERASYAWCPGQLKNGSKAGNGNEVCAEGPSLTCSGITSGPRGGVDAASEIKRSEPWPQLERPADHRHQLLPVPEQRLPQPEPSAWEMTPDPRPGD